MHIDLGVWRFVLVGFLWLGFGLSWYVLRRWKAIPHVFAHAWKWARRAILTAYALFAIFATMDVFNIIQISGTIVALYGLVLPAVALGLLQPLIPGLTIFLFRPYDIDDVVTVNIEGVESTGRITRIQLDRTHALEASGQMALWPNSQIGSVIIHRKPSELRDRVTQLDLSDHTKSP